MQSAPTAIILAAGKGTRMKSELRRYSFCLGPSNDPLGLGCAAVRRNRSENRGRRLSRRLGEKRTKRAIRRRVRAPGSAAWDRPCRANVPRSTGLGRWSVLIVAGDSPLIQSSSIATLLRLFDSIKPSCLMGTLVKDNPTGLGRIVRDSHRRFLRIVEHKDATRPSWRFKRSI